MRGIGFRFSVIGFWFSVDGCWLSVVYFRLSAFGCRFSVVSFRLSVFGCRLSIFGCRFSVVGFRLSIFGFRFSVFGCRFSVVGFRLSAAVWSGLSSGRENICISVFSCATLIGGFRRTTGAVACCGLLCPDGGAFSLQFNSQLKMDSFLSKVGSSRSGPSQTLRSLRTRTKKSEACFTPCPSLTLFIRFYPYTPDRIQNFVGMNV